MLIRHSDDNGSKRTFPTSLQKPTVWWISGADSEGSDLHSPTHTVAQTTDDGNLPLVAYRLSATIQRKPWVGIHPIILDRFMRDGFREGDSRDQTSFVREGLIFWRIKYITTSIPLLLVLRNISAVKGIPYFFCDNSRSKPSNRRLVKKIRSLESKDVEVSIPFGVLKGKIETEK